MLENQKIYEDIDNILYMPDEIMSCKKLTGLQKFLISYVLQLQRNNRKCIESNVTLAKIFGTSLNELKNDLSKLTEYSFFRIKDKELDLKQITIDEEVLSTFLLSI